MGGQQRAADRYFLSSIMAEGKRRKRARKGKEKKESFLFTSFVRIRSVVKTFKRLGENPLLALEGEGGVVEERKGGCLFPPHVERKRNIKITSSS